MRCTFRVLVVLCLLATMSSSTTSADDGKSPLEGEWLAQSMEANGKAAPAETVQRMRFTFKGDKLFVVGNFDDGREEECTFKLDSKPSPAHLDFTPPKGEKPVQGIYELKDGVLKVCLRHGNSDGARPTEFATKAGSQTVLIVFKKKG